MKKSIWAVMLLIGVLSCKKEYTQPRSGIFRGTFEKSVTTSNSFETGDCTLALNDKNESFSLNVDTISTVPYACGGSYAIIDATKISFSSSHLAPEFGDQYIILDSTFTYSFDDTRFDLTRKIDTVVYEYKFIRY